jgi:hypothetical protein
MVSIATRLFCAWMASSVAGAASGRSTGLRPVVCGENRGPCWPSPFRRTGRFRSYPEPGQAGAATNTLDFPPFREGLTDRADGRTLAWLVEHSKRQAL